MWLAILGVRLTFVTSEDSRLAVSLRREMELWHRPPITAIRVLKFCRDLSFCSNRGTDEKKKQWIKPLHSLDAWQHFVAYILFPVKSTWKQELCNSSPKSFPNTGTLLLNGTLISDFFTAKSFDAFACVLGVFFGLSRLYIYVCVVKYRAVHKAHMMQSFPLNQYMKCSGILKVSCLDKWRYDEFPQF